jgi:N-acetylglucosaminyldiphosphoundecaprenol N-acetyl-beta-D-mannosaminyltransferase
MTIKVGLSGIQKANILGVGVNTINMSQAVRAIESWINGCQQNYVCVTPAHAVMDCYHQPHLRRIFNSSGLTTPDGMSIVWLLKLFGYSHVERVYGPDLMLKISEYSQQTQWRHFFFGGAPGVADKLANGLKIRYSNLQVAGTYSPPFRQLAPQEDSEIVDRINSSRADIVWVGISSPKQEQWMYSHLGKVNAPVLIGVGAAFDFLSGNKKQAPGWMQRSGLEWLFRLAHEPQRLWRRYIQYPLFGLLVLSQVLGLKHFSIE